ncbi:unnamed protein product [Rotaria sp. Silwood2]|nr:unnamed protein product [Rotaria sp. Silwood2]CAF4350251.1 unnamed protein product [Rotaria sp. Silwood2]
MTTTTVPITAWVPSNYNTKFYTDDLNGTTTLSTNAYFHAAFVYDFVLNQKNVYLVGKLDGTSLSGNFYQHLSGNVTIGTIKILNDTSLIAHSPFDNTYNDVESNTMNATYDQQSDSSLSWIIDRVNQALSFDSSSTDFESCEYWTLGQNQAYSIAI